MTKAELEAAVKKLNEAEDKLRATETELAAARRGADESANRLETYQKRAADLKERLEAVSEDNRELSRLKEKYAALEQDLKRAAQDTQKYVNLFTDSQKEVDKLQKELKEVESSPPVVVDPPRRNRAGNGPAQRAHQDP